jgi:hypothetical protein
MHSLSAFCVLHGCAMVEAVVALRRMEGALKAGDVAAVAAELAHGGKNALDIVGRVNDWFIAACRMGHVEIAQQLLSLTGTRAVNVHACDRQAFYMACYRGHVRVVALLLGLQGDRAVNVHAANEHAFRIACKNRRPSVVALLLRLGGHRAVNVHAQDGVGLHYACFLSLSKAARLLLAHRNRLGAPVLPTVRRGRRWACVVWATLYHVAQPRWLAAVRRSGATAARAVRRQCRSPTRPRT